MALRDLLAGENDDAARASQAAASGRSLTGLSGRQTETQFAGRDDVFGGPAPATSEPSRPMSPEPVMGERIGGRRLDPIFGGGETQARDNDPVFRRPGAIVDRQPFGNQEQTLAYTPRPGYRPYWFSDIPGRIARAKRAGYTHIIDPDTGESMSRVTDRADGRGRSSYLMEIPIQWYQDDMGRQAASLAERIDQIRRGPAGEDAVENQYVPKQGIRISGR